MVLIINGYPALVENNDFAIKLRYGDGEKYIFRTKMFKNGIFIGCFWE